MLDFTSFFHHTLFGGRTLFFLQLGYFGLDITSFVFVYHKAGLWPVLNLSFFLYHRKEKVLKQILNTLTIFDLSVNIRVAVFGRSRIDGLWIDGSCDEHIPLLIGDVYKYCVGVVAYLV